MDIFFHTAFTIWGETFSWAEIIGGDHRRRLRLVGRARGDLELPGGPRQQRLPVHSLRRRQAVRRRGAPGHLLRPRGLRLGHVGARERRRQGRRPGAGTPDHRAEWVVFAVVGLALWGVCFAWLRHFTDSPVPTWDSLALALSLVATYGQARKLAESWWIWIAVDVVSVPLFLNRGLPLIAALYFVYLLICIVGLRSWQRAWWSSRPRRSRCLCEHAHGLVMGKFYPPHVGHRLLVRTAAATCERVTVLVLAHPAESISLEDRVDLAARDPQGRPERRRARRHGRTCRSTTTTRSSGSCTSTSCGRRSPR